MVASVPNNSNGSEDLAVTSKLDCLDLCYPKRVIVFGLNGNKTLDFYVREIAIHAHPVSHNCLFDFDKDQHKFLMFCCKCPHKVASRGQEQDWHAIVIIMLSTKESMIDLVGVVGTPSSQRSLEGLPSKPNKLSTKWFNLKQKSRGNFTLTGKYECHHNVFSLKNFEHFKITLSILEKE